MPFYSICLIVFTSPTTIYRPNHISTSDSTIICRPTSSSNANSTTDQSTAGIAAPNNPANATGPAATTTTARDQFAASPTPNNPTQPSMHNLDSKPKFNALRADNPTR